MEFDYTPFGVSDATVTTPEGKVIRIYKKPPQPKTIEEALRQRQVPTPEYIRYLIKKSKALCQKNQTQ